MKMKNEFVLIRGLGREAGHWLDFPQQLCQEFLDWSVVTEDLPGFGKRRHLPFPRNIEGVTEAMRNDILSRPAAKRVLVAVSLGGMVAADWIFRYPEDFAAAVVINTSFNGISTAFERLQVEGFYSLARAALEKEPTDRERWVLQLISNHRTERERALPVWTEIQRQRPVDPRVFLTQLWAASRFRVPRGRPEIPVLVVSSRRDRMVNPVCSERIAKRWRAAHVVHPTAGHDLPLDDGLWLARTIFQWLETTWPKNVARPVPL